MANLGFWGLQIEPSKTYSQTVDVPFRISNITFGEKITGSERSSLCVTVDDQKFVLGSLIPEKCEQITTDITFSTGEEITFEVLGANAVHLTGNYVHYRESDLDSEDDLEELNMSDLEEEIVAEQFKNANKKASPRQTKKQAKVSKIEELVEEDEEEESDPDFPPEADLLEEESDQEEEDSDADLDAMEDAMEEDEEKPPTPVKKDNKNLKRKPDAENKQNNKKVKNDKREANGTPNKKETPKKGPAAKKQTTPKDEEPKPLVKKTLPNGLVIEDVKIGKGPRVVRGVKVDVRYTGRLASNQKIFDQNKSGKPFQFTVGGGEVIKGWDLGVENMHAGSERKLIIPAELAYGDKGNGPDIPANSTLEFTVKVLRVIKRK